MNKAQWIKQNLKLGEVYAGIIFGQNGEKDYHLIAFSQDIENVTWDKAMAHAASIGGYLPDRREARLIAINSPESFDKSSWYWTSEQHASYSNYAWIQGFTDGSQVDHPKSSEYRARAVRRIYIKEGL